MSDRIHEIDKRIGTLQNDILSLQDEISRLQEERKTLDGNELYRIAESLHSAKCNWNHTDGCSWFYETWDGSTGAGNRERMIWVGKARNLVAKAKELGVTPESLIKIVNEF